MTLNECFNLTPQPFDIFFLVLIEIFKSYENFYSLAIVERVCKENVKMYNYLKNSLKTVAGSNSDTLRTFKGLRNFKMSPPLLKVLKKPLAIIFC